MTVLRLYTIHDRKTGAFEPPISSENDAAASRWFTRAVSQVPNLQQFPEDFALLYIGEFDTQTGLCIGEQTLQHVCSALDCIDNNQSMFEEMQNASNQVSDDTSVQSSAKGTNSA